MNVIGLGTGRTGTNSLKVAINQLGPGPCHHMNQVIEDMSLHVSIWSAALNGNPDWDAIFNGYNSAVDWSIAGFARELVNQYPAAKFILTHRNPDDWVASFKETIYTVLASADEAPAEMVPWLEMAIGVITRTGFPPGLNKEQLASAFLAHNNAVKAEIPAEQLLVFQVTQGWEPLCEFLNVPVPDTPFPRTNNRQEFWDLVPDGN